MESTEIIRRGNMKIRTRVTKEPYEAYTLPAVSEKGGQFVDFNEILKSIIPRKVKIVKKKRVTILERRNDNS